MFEREYGFSFSFSSAPLTSPSEYCPPPRNGIRLVRLYQVNNALFFHSNFFAHEKARARDRFIRYNSTYDMAILPLGMIAFHFSSVWEFHEFAKRTAFLNAYAHCCMLIFDTTEHIRLVSDMRWDICYVFMHEYVFQSAEFGDNAPLIKSLGCTCS